MSVPPNCNLDVLKKSTHTIIVLTNFSIHLDLFFKYMPVFNSNILPYPTKRKVFDLLDKHDTAKGQIISIEYGDKFRGTPMKYKKKVEKMRKSYLSSDSKKSKSKLSSCCFQNSSTVVMYLEKSKAVNIKVSHNGKLQITGCQKEEQFIESVFCLYIGMMRVSALIGQAVISVPSGENPYAIFEIVMINYGFDLGFRLNREKLDRFINGHSAKTGYIANYESTVNFNVNVKIPSGPPDMDETLIKMTILPTKYHMCKDQETMTNCIQLGEILLRDYLEMVSELSKSKMLSKPRYHTFLCFSKGRCIITSRPAGMKDKFKDFVCLLHANRSLVEDTRPLI